VTTAFRAQHRQGLLFGVALAWAVATWLPVGIVTDVDRDTAALWIGVALTLVGPPALAAAAVAILLAGRRAGARRTPGLLGLTGGTFLLTAFVGLAGAGAFLYPFNTDDSRAPVLGSLAPFWYVLGILLLLAGLVALVAAVVARVRSRRAG
jgi:hypothetical protein